MDVQFFCDRGILNQGYPLIFKGNIKNKIYT